MSPLTLPKARPVNKSIVEEVIEFEDAADPADAFALPDLMPRVPRHPLRFISWVVRCLFGIVTLIVLLAVVAAIPIVNFLALGYLFEAEGRVARTGKLRHAIPLLPLAPRIGSVTLGISFWLTIVTLVATSASQAAIIDPGGPAAMRSRIFTMIVSAFTIVHLCLALARGGMLSCFFRPIKNLRWLLAERKRGPLLSRMDDKVELYLRGMRLGHHFWLGLRGFFGALIWLFVPTLLLSVASQTKAGPVLVSILGGILLTVVFAWLPFLQARFSEQQRFRAMFELRAVRELFRRAPIVWLLAVIGVFVLALPLHLAKVELPPQDAMWLVTLIFIVMIYPARILTGWAYYRASNKTRRAWFPLPMTCRMIMLPLLGVYSFLIFFSQAFGEHGKLALFEHHAFLLPAPFLLGS